MFLVVDAETQSAHRYHPRAIYNQLPAAAEYVVYHNRSTTLTVEQYDGIILSGSSAHVYADADATLVSQGEKLIKRCIESQIPLLGICFGHQWINQALGGTVERSHRRTGFVSCQHDRTGILSGVGETVPVVHSDLVTDPGDGLTVIGSTAYNEAFCTRHTAAPCWSVQFHPEFTPAVAAQIPDWEAGLDRFAKITADAVLKNFVEVARQK